VSGALVTAEAASEAPRPRHWGLRHDREKDYAIRLGSRHPPLYRQVKAWVWEFELPAVAIYRLGQLAHTLMARSKLLGLPLYIPFLMLQWWLRLLLHVHIADGARIGPALHLGHPYGIIIGPTEIGANCSVSHGVTIGEGLSSSGARGLPVVKDNVWIGPGSFLSGPITIGEGATIAACSVVVRDIPPRALVAGNPARVVAASYDNAELLGYDMGVVGAGGTAGPVVTAR
jgi:serine O-acetyltransferase